MSPAGYWPQLQAAIEAGADAVYFGLKHFTARAKVGFTLAELPEVMRTLHRRGVRGFVTYNTLVFEHELETAARGLKALAEAGADAIIVQDLGVLKLAREIVPAMELHASTQMSVTDLNGVRLAARLGARRVTLARELSLKEIGAIAAEAEVELEVFVHGALCVAYSGQCLSSEAWGGRSANRGQCAQACRLPYELVVDGAPRPLGDARYLLSPGDLCALDQMPEIVALGIAACKIEGRYKEAEYVAAATAAYRKAIDDAWAARPLSVTAVERLDLEQVYSRGMGPYFITGTDHQTVVRGRAPRHRGVYMGVVEGVGRDFVTVRLGAAHRLSPLKPGDGVVFDAADWRSPEESEEGGRVYEAAPAGKLLELRFGRGAVNTRRIRPGDWVWRTDDPALEQKLRAYTRAASPLRRQAVSVQVTAHAGRPLTAHWTAGPHSVTVASAAALSAAAQRPLDAGMLRAQFERLGGTPWELAELTADIQGRPFAPVSLLNQLRREAVEQLTALAERPRVLAVHAPAVLQRNVPEDAEAGAPQLHLLVRTPEQLDAALEARPASVTLDYLDLYGLRPSLERVRAAGAAVRVATPRILKPGEEKITEFLLRLECPLLVRPAGLAAELGARGGRELTGDFSLNAANTLAAEQWLSLGLCRITPAHDLNGAQVAALARGVGGQRIEAVAYQHLPVFHTEHCVFCRFLSTGKSHEDCGRPCEQRRIAVRDVNGRAHPVLADTGCRNTVFGAEAQQAGAHMAAWLEAGVRHFRLEFAHETAEATAAVAAAFQRAFQGEVGWRELTADLARSAPQGVAEGSLFVAEDYLSLPVLD